MPLRGRFLQSLSVATLIFWTASVHAAPAAAQDDDQCMRVLGAFTCDDTSATWNYDFVLVSLTALDIDTIQAVSRTPGVELANGPYISLGVPTTTFEFTPMEAGQPFDISICAFNFDEAESDEPYDCCRQVVSLSAPTQECGPE